MKYNFIHVPKTAGNSLLKVIEGRSVIVYHGHVRAKDVVYPNMISFLRNPYDRVVSTYFYLLLGGMHNSLDLHLQGIIKAYKTFDNFVLNIEKDGLIEKVLHLKPMHYWVCDEDRILPTCYKIEEVEKIDSFLKEVGLESISNIRANASKHFDYRTYLVGDIKEELYRLYEKDFKLFNYDK